MKVIKNLESFRRKVFNMHADEIFNGGRGATTEFSYMAFYDTETGEWEEPIITDSFNDSAVTTTSLIEGEQAVVMAQKLAENPNLIYVWGHSHVNMGTSPSAQDIRTLKENELEMACISNNKGELRLLLLEGDNVYEITKHGGHPTYTTNYKGTNKHKKRGSKSKHSAGRSTIDFTDDQTDGYNYGQYFSDTFYK